MYFVKRTDRGDTLTPQVINSATSAMALRAVTHGVLKAGEKKNYKRLLDKSTHIMYLLSENIMEATSKAQELLMKEAQSLVLLLIPY